MQKNVAFGKTEFFIIKQRFVQSEVRRLGNIEVREVKYRKDKTVNINAGDNRLGNNLLVKKFKKNHMRKKKNVAKAQFPSL